MIAQPPQQARSLHMTEQPQTETRRSPLERFFGGHPVNVILKLAFISLLVGFTMSVFGLNVEGLVRGAVELLREALRDGVGLFRNLGAYILTGAALVVPIWLLIRLGKAR
jgi:hypothetical protein